MIPPDNDPDDQEYTDDDAYSVYNGETLDEAIDEAGYAASDTRLDDDWPPDDIRPTQGQQVWARARWVILPISLAIPFLLLVLLIAGWGFLTGDHSDSDGPGGPTPTRIPPTPVPGLIADWPQDVIYAPHTVPAMIRDELAFAGARLGYQFVGSAGATWRITVAPVPGSAVDPQFHLYEPAGTELAQGSEDLLVILPEDGTYRLLIESAQNGVTTGTYLLTVFAE